MEPDPIDDFHRSRPVSRRRQAAIARELSGHIEETHRDLILAGWQPTEALSEARRRLGDGNEIAAAFTEVYRPSRRVQLSLALTLATGMLAAGYGLGGTLASATAVHLPVIAHVHQLPSKRQPSGH